MSGWPISFISLFIFVIALMVAVPISLAITEMAKKLKYEILKKKLSENHRYNCYFINENDLKRDSNAAKLAAISYHGYTETSYEVFYKKLSTDRIPINMLVNWTKTIVEDLKTAVSPINHVQNWSRYFDSDEYKDYAIGSVHPDYIVFEDYELSYIWGAVYYWLKVFVEDFDNEDLLHYIEKVACKKQFLRPYFYHYKNLADGKNDTLEVYYTSDSPQQRRTLTAEQTALLWLAIAMMTEDNISKKSLAPVISKISGVGLASIKNKIVGSFKEEDKKIVASIFEDSMPNLAAKIKKM